MSSAAYTIAANLEMKSNAPGVLIKLIESFERLDKVVRESQKAIGTMAEAINTLKNAGRSLGALERAMDKLGKNDGAKQGAQQAETFARATREAAGAQEALARATRDAASAQRGLNETRGRMTSGSSSAAAAAAGTAPPSTAHQRALALRAQRAGGGPAAAAAPDNRHLDSTDAMMVGMAGHSAVTFVERAAHQAMEPAQVMSMLATDNRNTPEQIQKAYDTSLAATRSAPGTNMGRNMEAVMDISNVVGSLDDAIKMLPQFAQLSSVLGATDKKNGGNGDQAFAAAKAMEVLGMLTKETRGADGKIHHEIDPGAFTQHMEAMTRVAVATGGRVLPTDYLRYAKQGRIGAMQQDDRFTFSQLPSLLMVLGGERTGTALNSASQVFEGGKLQNKTMEAMIQFGLADKGGITRVKGRDGKMHDKVNTSAIHNVDLLRTNIVEWVRTVTQKMEAEGKSKEQILQIFQKVSQRSTIGGLLADIYKDMPGIDREEKHINSTLQGPGAIQNFMQSNPNAQVNSFTEGFNNLMAVLGGPVLAKALPAMDAMVVVMNKFGDWANNHQGATAVIMGTIAAVGILTVAIGALGVASMFAGSGFKLLGGIGKLLGIGGGAALAGEAGAAGVAGAAAGGAGILAVVGGAAMRAKQALDLSTTVYGLAGAGDRALGRLIGRPDGIVGGAVNSLPSWAQKGIGYAMMTVNSGTDHSAALRGGQQSAPAAAVPAAPTSMTGTVNLDGKAVGRFVANSLANGANMPSVGAQPGARGGGMTVPGNSPVHP